MSLQDELINLIIEPSDYAAAKSFIDLHPNIVNELFEDNDSFLMCVLGCAEESDETIEFLNFVILSTDPDQLNYRLPHSKRSAFDMALDLHGPRIVQVFIDHAKTKGIDIYEHPEDGKLQWEVIHQEIEDTLSSIARFEQSSRDVSKALKRACDKRDRLLIIVEQVRDALILHAIDTDNPDYLRRLEAAGGTATGRLSNGIHPMDYAKELQKEQINAFYNGEYQEILAQNMAQMHSAMNRLSFFDAKTEELKQTAEAYTAAIAHQGSAARQRTEASAAELDTASYGMS